MRIMAWAAVSISSIFKSAFFSTRSRPPPEPLRRPSLHRAFERFTDLGAAQMPRAALLVLSGMTAWALLSCGTKPDVRATQQAFMAERDYRMSTSAPWKPTPSPTADPTESRRATIQAESERRKRVWRAQTATVVASATAWAEKYPVLAARQRIAATVETRRAEATATMKRYGHPPCRNFRTPPWLAVPELQNKQPEAITNAEVRMHVSQEDIRDYLQWRGRPDTAGCPKVPMPRTAPGTRAGLLDDPHWRPTGLATPTATPVGWHVYPWRRTPTP